MPSFSKKSLRRLSTCHPDLQRLFRAVVPMVDCTILDGYRGKTRQNKLFDQGKSKVRFPEGKHNDKPSNAIDVAPWPVPDWKDLNTFYFFSGVVKGIAIALEIKIRWGGDWDGDNDLHDQTFNDLVHFERVEE
ncbi:M15 family peptidase [bacterium]|nr:M15 family peptidase [bacterium]